MPQKAFHFFSAKSGINFRKVLQDLFVAFRTETGPESLRPAVLFPLFIKI
jgi:hypothetical protein